MKKHHLSFFIFLAFFAGLAGETPLSAQSVDLDTTLMTKMLRDTGYVIAPGVRETDLKYLNAAGKPMAVYVLRVDLKEGDLGMEAATPFGRDTFCRQTMMRSIGWESRPGHHVLAAVNADFFNMKNGMPEQMEIRDGKILRDTARAGREFAGVLKNGRVIIGDAGLYARKKRSLQDALGGYQLLVRKGRPVPQLKNSFSLTRHPRTALGLVNAHTVLFVVVDGRQPAYSNGMPLDELAHLMKLLGAKTAINLDGGGSSTMVSLDPGSGRWRNRNRPSGKQERAVANGWMIVDYR